MKKKLLALTMVLIIMMPLCVLAQAEEDNINDSLVSWWNFEGANNTEILKDKAPKGKKSDDLTQVGGEIKYENGVAYVPSAINNALSLNAASEDLNNVYSMTLYMKAKYNGNNTDFADLFCYNGLYRVYKLKDSVSGHGAVLQATAFATANNADLGTVRIRPQTPLEFGIMTDEWFYVALTMNVDMTTNVGTAVIYISKDGLSYTKTELTMPITSAIYEDMATRAADTQAEVLLGKLSLVKDIPDRYINYWYDDVRIYNTVLDESDLARIIPNSLDLREKSEIPDTSDTTAPSDTNAPDTATTTTKTPTTSKPASTGAVSNNTQKSTQAATSSAGNTETGGVDITVVIVIGVAVAAAVCVAVVIIVKKKK